MGHKCFISYKKEDKYYLEKLKELFDNADVIDNSLDRIIDSEDGDYIMYVIRRDYLKDSTVTIFLIGEHSSENEGFDWQGRPHNYFIQKELQASLYDGKYNRRSGILGIVLPSMYDKIYKGTITCATCGGIHNYVNVNDDTTIREFSKNYYLEPHEGCAWSEDERYCVLVKWEDFFDDSEFFIEQAFKKRDSDVAKKVRVWNLR